MSGALLIPLAVVLFWVWQLCAWIVAIGRRERMGGPRPTFMGGVSLRLALALLELGEFIGLLVRVFLVALPVVGGVALGIGTFALVCVLARDIGWIAALAAGIVVYGGITVPATLVLQRLGPLLRREQQRRAHLIVRSAAGYERH